LAEAAALPSAVRHLAVDRVPHSGKADELLDKFGISAKHVVAAVESLK
jgi:transketolase C-terminal domain/subunit